MSGPDPSTPSSIGDRVNHISHVDVNVSDAERSRRFYEATMPLEVAGRISCSGSFPSLGIDQGRFEGYVLRNITQLGDYPTVRLIEWKTPTPVGIPYSSHANVGWYRLVSTVRDIERARDVVVAHGGQPLTETTEGELRMYGPDVPPGPYRTFHARDPDGVTIQWSYDGPREGQPTHGAPPGSRGTRWLEERPLQDRLFALVGGTTNVDEYYRFYTEVLGFDIFAGLQTPDPVPNVYGPAGGSTLCDGAFFVPRGDRRFVIDWLRWYESTQHATPYRQHNHLGIIRCGIEVDDLDSAFTSLYKAAQAHPHLVTTLHPVEMWDLGDDLGENRVVNFEGPEGVMFQLVEAQPYKLGRLHPWGADRIDFSAPRVELATSAMSDGGIRPHEPERSQARHSVRILFVESDGSEHHVDADVGESLMCVAVRNDISGIEGECGGQMSCGTCHMQPRPGFSLPPRSYDEDEMLEMVDHPSEHSRLGCQIRVDHALAGLVVDVPPAD